MQLIIRALALFAFAALAHAQNISIATGGTGGVYYPLGGGLAAVLTKYVPGLEATAEVTAGSIANLQLIGGGEAQPGLPLARFPGGAVHRPGKVHGQEGGRGPPAGVFP